MLSLNETWLKPHQQVRIPNYTLVRKDRPAQAGGGVLLAIHRDILFEPVKHEYEEEIVAVKLVNASPEGESITIASLYNPPDQTIPTETIKDLFKKHHNAISSEI